MKNKILNILKDNTYCRLQPSPIHGIGVFAIKDIPDGVNPFSDSLFTDDILIKHEELEVLDREVKDLVYTLYMSDENGVYFQGKDEQPVTRRRCHVLTAVDAIANRTVRDHATQRLFPKEVPGTRV